MAHKHYRNEATGDEIAVGPEIAAPFDADPNWIEFDPSAAPEVTAVENVEPETDPVAAGDHTEE